MIRSFTRDRVGAKRGREGREGKGGEIAVNGPGSRRHCLSRERPGERASDPSQPTNLTECLRGKKGSREKKGDICECEEGAE